MAVYPCPDFERTDLNWTSLNGTWNFLFDDEDVGLIERWHDQGLPAKVTLKGSNTSDHVQSSESDSITRKIADGTQNLLGGNPVAKVTGEATTNERREIQVPFVFQSPASGINDRGVHEVLWYERQVTSPSTKEQRERGDRTILRFGAVDYYAQVWAAGEYVGDHRGGNVPFEFDITNAFKSGDGSVSVVVRVYDSAYDLAQPRGKQYWGAKPESIFYTPSGGIWQNVWVETVPSTRIADSSHGTVIRSNDIDSGDLHATIAVAGRRAGHAHKIELEASFQGAVVAKSGKTNLPRERDTIDLDLNLRLSEKQRSELPEAFLKTTPLSDETAWKDGLALWSPTHPLLYTLKIRLYGADDTLLDEVTTLTGMRSITWTTGASTILLNHRPLFQALCLDQGYWPETLLTPPSPEALLTDIKLAQAMGFNGCRKHQKAEDPLFLHYADQAGYLVWGEMASAYTFSGTYASRFSAEWAAAVARDINHASVVAWTPANESWGYADLAHSPVQRAHLRALYWATKTLDPTRPVNGNCGWEHVVTDMTTFHDYADAPALRETCASLDGILGPKAGRPVFVDEIPGVDAGARHVQGAPVLCTEFGGVNIKPKEGEANEWGYTTASDPKDLLERIERLIMAVVEGGLCCGFVWTQLTDIEQETNGLHWYDRTPKLAASDVKAVMDKAQKLFYSQRGL